MATILPVVSRFLAKVSVSSQWLSARITHTSISRGLRGLTQVRSDLRYPRKSAAKRLLRPNKTRIYIVDTCGTSWHITGIDERED